VILTPATESDRGPIVGSWIDSYRNAHSAGLIAMERWGEVMRTELNALLSRCTTVVMRGTEPETFYGWIAFEWPDLLHYVYVWKPYRGRGVARALIREANLDKRFTYSCRTPRGEEIARAMSPRPRFNPLPARYGKRKPNGKAPIIEYRRSGTGPTADTCTDAA
jgi:GNAT superfamily N-acetyltransferase